MSDTIDVTYRIITLFFVVIVIYHYVQRIG